jgi:branched-chain amino acid transport system substrate-binding protein
MQFKAMLSGILVLAATAAAAQDAPGVTEDTIRVGIWASLTGDSAYWGTVLQASAEMAFKEANASGGINGRRIEWIVEDDETSPKKAIATFGKLSQDDSVFAVFGPDGNAIAEAMIPIISKVEMPIFVPMLNTPVLTEPLAKNIFRAGPVTDRAQGMAIVKFILGKGGHRIAIITQADEYGSRAAGGISAQMKQDNIAPVATEQFGANDNQFVPQLSRIRQSNPDFLIVYGFASPSALIIRQARQIGIGAAIIGSNMTSSREFPAMVGSAGVGYENLITVQALPESDDPRAVSFSNKFSALYPTYAEHNRPDLGDAHVYSGALTFLEGLRRAGRDLTRKNFVSALESIHDFEVGITMPITFSADSHEGTHLGRIMQIQPDLTRKLIPDLIPIE